MYENVPFLPMSRQEMKKLGWDSIDILLLTGDAYVEHPSFGTAVIGRYLLDKGIEKTKVVEVVTMGSRTGRIPRLFR